MNETLTNTVHFTQQITPQAVAYNLKEWIGVCGIAGMALIHAYQIVVNAGGVKTIAANFIGGKPQPPKL